MLPSVSDLTQMKFKHLKLFSEYNSKIFYDLANFFM